MLIAPGHPSAASSCHKGCKDDVVASPTECAGSRRGAAAASTAAARAAPAPRPAPPSAAAHVGRSVTRPLGSSGDVLVRPKLMVRRGTAIPSRSKNFDETRCPTSADLSPLWVHPRKFVFWSGASFSAAASLDGRASCSRSPTSSRNTRTSSSPSCPPRQGIFFVRASSGGRLGMQPMLRRSVRTE